MNRKAKIMLNVHFVGNSIFPLLAFTLLILGPVSMSVSVYKLYAIGAKFKNIRETN